MGANVDDHPLDRIDPTFIDDLRESRASVEVVAEWLSSKGYPVILRPTFERPDASQRLEYSDDGDLEIIQRVEVKRRFSLTFSSLADFPHPTLIVDVAHNWDRKRPKPYAYVILNREMTAAFVVEGRTRPHWRKVSRWNPHGNRQQEFYEVPLEYVRLERLARRAEP